MDSQWLQTQFRLHPAKSKADLARVLGLEPPAISKILGGGRQIKAQEYIMMRQFFGLPVDGERALAVTASRSVAVGGLAEGASSGGYTSYAPSRAVPSQRPSTNLSEQLRVFRVEEDVMEPDYARDEHVLVDTTQKSPDPAGVFIVCDGFTYMIRDCAYTADGDNGKVRVSARKKDFQAQILAPHEFLVIGRVVAKILWT
jgi:hypothetical protein